MKIAENVSARKSFRILTAVYQQAERRAATDHAFVFLGDIFDSVKEPFTSTSGCIWLPWGMSLWRIRLRKLSKKVSGPQEERGSQRLRDSQHDLPIV
jgi:hypothetical protein